MATSTSRATGKVTATLVMTAACLSQNSPPQHHQTLPKRPPPIVEEKKPDPVGVSRASSGGSGSGEAVPTATSGRRVEESVETSANEYLASSARTTSDKEARARDAETSEKAVGVTGAGAVRSGIGGEGLEPCRQRTSGPLRGGDLM